MKTDTAISELKESVVGHMLNAVQQGSGQEAGDPAKAAEAVIKVVKNLLASIEEWKETTINADFKK
ncbi:hypothetical protein [Cohnella yongneupensis]|uniref:Variable large protein n=1 Tax=Cohnella yongneupensis TaxID=425006 RepID=A0ABW0R049_9BACL